MSRSSDERAQRALQSGFTAPKYLPARHLRSCRRGSKNRISRIPVRILEVGIQVQIGESPTISHGPYRFVVETCYEEKGRNQSSQREPSVNAARTVLTSCRRQCPDGSHRSSSGMRRNNRRSCHSVLDELTNRGQEQGAETSRAKFADWASNHQLFGGQLRPLGTSASTLSVPRSRSKRH